MFNKTILMLILMSGVAMSDEVAGRVNVVDRNAKTIVVHPYKDRTKTPAIQPPDVLLHMKNDTKYVWSSKPDSPTAPTFDQVKSGSWVRVTYDSRKSASKVVIHLKTE